MQKGKIEVFNFKKNKKNHKLTHVVEGGGEFEHRHHRGYENDDGRKNNIESSKEFSYTNKYGENTLSPKFEQKEYDNLFDEHFSNDK